MSTRRTVAATLAMLFLAAPLAAQGANPVAPDQAMTAPAVAAATPTADVAPTIANAAVGVRATAVNAAVAPAPLQGRVGRNPAMMIVGGVALIAGSFIDGDAGTIIMISGAVIGIYGLWQYLK